MNIRYIKWLPMPSSHYIRTMIINKHLARHNIDIIKLFKEYIRKKDIDIWIDPMVRLNKLINDPKIITDIRYNTIIDTIIVMLRRIGIHLQKETYLYGTVPEELYYRNVAFNNYNKVFEYAECFNMNIEWWDKTYTSSLKPTLYIANKDGAYVLNELCDHEFVDNYLSKADNIDDVVIEYNYYKDTHIIFMGKMA